MKKLFLLLVLFSLQSCIAQQPFEDAEYQAPVFLTVTGVLSMNSDGTASIVQNNEYQRVFHFDGKKDMVEGWKYTVGLRIENPGDLKNRNLIRATLVDYGISVGQARINAVRISQMGKTDKL
jgi:hypothetical protein